MGKRNMKKGIFAGAMIGVFAISSFANAMVAEPVRFGSEIEPIRNTFEAQREEAMGEGAEARQMQLRESAQDFNQNVQAVVAERVSERRAMLAGLDSDEREEKIAEIRSDLNERLLNRLNDFLDRMSDLFEKRLDRMEAFADRVLAIIERLEDVHEGIDLSEARGLLDIARLDLELAQTTLEDLEAQIDGEIIDGESVRSVFKDIKEMVRDYKKDYIDPAHKSLVDAVVSVRAAASLRPELSDDSDDSEGSSSEDENEDESEDSDDESEDDDSDDSGDESEDDSNDESDEVEED